MAVFKPTKIIGFEWEEGEREWDTTKIEEIRKQTHQGELFPEEAWKQTFKIIPKLPYNFSYLFQDESGQKSRMQVLDWEVGALFWNCRRNAGGDEQLALKKVRTKYLDEFFKTDLHFFLGTTQQFHFVSPNPLIIVGVFSIPHEKAQLSLL